MSDTTERHLLRDIDDAEVLLAHYRRTFTLMLTGLAVCVLGTALGLGLGIYSVGSGQDWGLTAAVVLFPGIIGAIALGCFSVWWWDLHHMHHGKYQGPASRVVTVARRAHEDFLADQPAPSAVPTQRGTL